MSTMYYSIIHYSHYIIYILILLLYMLPIEWLLKRVTVWNARLAPQSHSRTQSPGAWRASSTGRTRSSWMSLRNSIF